MMVGEGRIDAAALKRDHPLPALLAASGVRLSPAGPGRWKGRCPFHDDHRPSLRVHPERNVWYCDPCGAGGDALAFVMRHEELGFAEAVREVAAC